MKRILTPVAVCAATLAVVLSGPAARAQAGGGVRAQGSPYLGEFLALSNKRADLRAALARKGLEAAFSAWLRAERPSAYKDAANRVAARGQSAPKPASCCGGAAACCSPSSSCCGKPCCASCGAAGCCK